MYHVLKIEIDKDHRLYDYLLNIGKLSNNLYNAALYRVRQILSMKNKEILTDNEKEVLKEIEEVKSFSKRNPSSSYYYLIDLLKYTHNVDYFIKDIPAQTKQHIVKTVSLNIKAFFESLKEYKKDPSLFKGRPKLPKYKRKKGISSFKFTNQDCLIKKNKKGRYSLKLPLTKDTLSLGNKVIGNLKEVQVSYSNQRFFLSLILEDDLQEKEFKDPKRIIGIDLGLNNLMSITNNCDLENLIYKGTILKSINHLYNKKIANIMSFNKNNPTSKYYYLTNKRNNQIKDYLSKISNDLIKWCVENRIDTIVIGSNKFWKDEINLGKANNQNFNQIPFDYLKRQIEYRAIKEGINYIETEESYTSKASFIDKDLLTKTNFSGKRIKRGLYKTKKGIIINADLNGSANIIRKVFDDKIKDLNFNKVKIIKNILSSSPVIIG